MDQYQKFEDILFQRPVKFEDSEVEVGVDISSDRSILRKFIISQPFHKVSKVDKNPFIRWGAKLTKTRYSKAMLIVIISDCLVSSFSPFSLFELTTTMTSMLFWSTTLFHYRFFSVFRSKMSLS